MEGFISMIPQKLCFNKYIPQSIYITIQLLFFNDMVFQTRDSMSGLPNAGALLNVG